MRSAREDCAFQDGVGTLDFSSGFNFDSDPSRACLVLEIERFALFRSQSDCLGVVFLLGVAKELFKGMFIGHRLFSRSELAGQSGASRRWDGHRDDH